MYKYKSKALIYYILHLFLTEHKDVEWKRNGKAITEKRYPTKLNSQCRGSGSLDVSVEGRMPLPVKSTDSERDVSNTNQTAHTSIDPGDGWTLVTSKSQRLKSVTERTSISDWPSFRRRSFVEDNRTLQGPSSTATKRFPTNRVQLQGLKSKQKSREHFRRGTTSASSGFAGNTDYVLRQSQNSSRHLKSAKLYSFLSREESRDRTYFRQIISHFPIQMLNALNSQNM